MYCFVDQVLFCAHYTCYSMYLIQINTLMITPLRNFTYIYTYFNMYDIIKIQSLGAIPYTHYFKDPPLFVSDYIHCK